MKDFTCYIYKASHKKVFRHALVVEIYLQQELKNNLLTDSTRTKKKNENITSRTRPIELKETIL